MIGMRGPLYYLPCWARPCHVHRQRDWSTTDGWMRAPAGAIRAPTYIHGVTSLAEWTSTIRNYPAPWGEVISRKLIISTQRSALQVLDTPNTTADYWDRVSGGVGGGRPHDLPSLRLPGWMLHECMS